MNLPRLKKENETLRQKVGQLENEITIVNWYMQVMESGIDTKTVIHEFCEL